MSVVWVGALGLTFKGKNDKLAQSMYNIRRCIMSKRFLWLIPILCLSLTLGGCTNFNLFGWTHKRGGDSSVPALLADAAVALEDEDYAEAIDLYEEILDKDSDNAEALYGLAQAILADAGFSIADIIANLIEENKDSDLFDSSSYKVFSTSSGQSLRRAADFGEDNIIPENIDLADLLEATTEVIVLLQQIVDGEADGSISPDNVDVNINLALAYLLHSACLIADTNGNGRNDSKDVYVVTTDYEIEEHLENVTSSNKSAVIARLNNAKSDIINAKDCLLVVIDVLDIEDEGELLNDLLEDFEVLMDEIDEKLDSIAAV